MRILIASKYMRHLGGVETYIGWLSRALVESGHDVAGFGMDFPQEGERLLPDGCPLFESPIRSYSTADGRRVRSALDSVYSPLVKRRLQRAVASFRPDLIHFHGTCYQLTPSVFVAADRRRVPWLITAHEYKLACANQRLWDDAENDECYACVGQTPLQKSRLILGKRCVKAGFGPSALAAAEVLAMNRVLTPEHTWVHAPSRFMQQTLVGDGWHADRVRYLDLPWSEPAERSRGRSTGEGLTVAYLGRLAVEKGVDRLIRCWPRVLEHEPRARLVINGDGDERQRLERLARELSLTSVVFAGRYEPSAVAEVLSGVVLTVHPSIWAENSPFTVRESLLHGVPVVVSPRGGLPEMVPAGCGVVARDMSEMALSDAIVDLIRNPPDAGPMQKAVAARAVSDQAHLRGLAELFEEVVASRAPGVIS